MSLINSINNSKDKNINIRISKPKLLTYALGSSIVGFHYASDSFIKSQKPLKLKLAQSTGKFIKGYMLISGCFAVYETVNALFKNKN